MEILENKIILKDHELQFNFKILEAVEYDGKLVIVFDTDEDNGYDNVYCYTLEKQIIWRIKPVPAEIGGIARTPYVGVDVSNHQCRIIDFYGRRFYINTDNGEIISKDIVR